jgi:hypothetical protein
MSETIIVRRALQDYLRKLLTIRGIAEVPSIGPESVTAIIVGVDEPQGRKPRFRSETYGFGTDPGAKHELSVAVRAMGKGDPLDQFEAAADLLLTEIQTAAMIVSVRKGGLATIFFCRHPDFEEEHAIGALYDAVEELNKPPVASA